MDEQHHTNPIDAHREGLERLERAPHHQTTEHDKPPSAPATRPISDAPAEQHRGGPLPYQKK